MRPEDIDYFSKFMTEFQGETDRGAALVGAAIIDDRLGLYLKSFLLDCKESEDLFENPQTPLSSFATKAKLAYCLGLITKLEYEECNLIRKIRNEFAHGLHGLTFKSEQVSKLCSKLRAQTPDNKRYDGDPRALFIGSVMFTFLALFYRHELIIPQRCKTRAWDYQLLE